MAYELALDPTSYDLSFDETIPEPFLADATPEERADHVILFTVCESCGEINVHLTSMCPVAQGFIGAAMHLAMDSFPLLYGATITLEFDGVEMRGNTTHM